MGVDGAPTEAVTVEDRRHLGSDTKAMTATLAAMVVEQSALEFDTPVTQILPEADPAWASVTVRHLLSHTSGLHDDTGLARFVTNASRAGDDAADDALVAMASAGLD